MKRTKVYHILNTAPLARDERGIYHSDRYEFKVHYNSEYVYMVEMIRKGDYKDALSDYNNSVFIKTLKDLKSRMPK